MKFTPIRFTHYLLALFFFLPLVTAFSFELQPYGPGAVFPGHPLYINVQRMVTNGTSTANIEPEVTGLPSGVTVSYPSTTKYCCTGFGYSWWYWDNAANGSRSNGDIRVDIPETTLAGEYTITITGYVRPWGGERGASISVPYTFTVLPQATPLPSTPTQPAPPLEGLAVWESTMISSTRAGGGWSCANNAGGWEGEAWYYDGTRVFYQVADYTGDSRWNGCAINSTTNWYRGYVLGAGGNIPGYRVFPHGLRQHWLRTDDQTSYDALLALSRNNSWANSYPAPLGNVDTGASREVAYALNTILEACRAGVCNDTKRDYLADIALGHLISWFVTPEHMDATEPDPFMQPFMVGLTSEALIDYYEVTADPRVPIVLAAAADGLWNRTWNAQLRGFQYADRVYSNGDTTVYPDLNNLIVPLYGFLFSITGNETYRERGDSIFAGAAAALPPWMGKQYSQNYRWSFAYLTYRNHTINGPTPPPEPLDSGICEATGAGRCFYVDPVIGHDDTNNGSFTSPFKSMRNFRRFYNNLGCAPANRVVLRPGDVVYLRDGVHSTVLRKDTDAGCNTDPNPALIYIQTDDGTAEHPITITSYPGEWAIFDSQRTGRGLFMQGADYWVLKNFEMRNLAYPYPLAAGYNRDQMQGGLYIENLHNLTIDTVIVHHADGRDNDNHAGLYLNHVDDLVVKNSVFYDNTDTLHLDTPETSYNAGNVMIMFGNRQTFLNNTFYHSVPITSSVTGMCLKQKKASELENSYFHIINNTFRNCKNFAVSIGTHNLLISGNMFIDGDGIAFRAELANTMVNMTVERNTFVGTDFIHNGLFRIEQFSNAYPPFLPIEPADITFRNNIIYDRDITRFQRTGEFGSVSFHPYYSDDEYTALRTALTMQNNCYYNPAGQNAFRFAFATGNPSSTGGMYNLTAWKAQGFDSGSVFADPLFVNLDASNLRLQAGSPCSAMGVFATAATPLPTPAYPNRPAGLTVISDSFNATTRVPTGWSPWNIDSTAADPVVVIDDATNPRGSGKSLQFTWRPTTSPKSATGGVDFVDKPYDHLYVLWRVYYENNASWQTAGHKFFYIGAPSTVSSSPWSEVYISREANGRVQLTRQGGPLVTTALLSSASGLLSELGTWYNLELELRAQSAPGIADGVARFWSNGVLIAENTAINWANQSFGNMEYYATANTVNEVQAYRIGEVYIAGAKQQIVRRTGDLNGDGVVDIQDVILIIQNFKRRQSYDAGADINNDGVVNVFDMVLLGRQWG